MQIFLKMWLVVIPVVVFLGVFFVYKIARIWADKEWGKDQLKCDIDYVMAHAKPGDLIHFQGSAIIRWTSPIHTFSHVGVIVRAPSGHLAISEAYKTVIDRDVIRNDWHDGVQTVDLRRRLNTYETGRMAWRPVRGDDRTLGTRNSQILAMIRSYDVMPKYNMNIFDLGEYQTGADNDENLDAEGNKMFVCTSWVTHVYQTIGWLPENIYDGTLTLAHYGNDLPLPLTPQNLRWEKKSYIQKDLLRVVK